MEFLTLNPVVVSAVSSMMMVIIWLVYLHLALHQYRLSNRPYMIIHRADENNPKAPCLFVNMSKEPVHVTCVIVNIHKTNSHERWFITDYDRVNADDEKVQAKLRQGPIMSGGYLILGSFFDFISAHAPKENADNNPVQMATALSEVKSIEICVTAVHGGYKQHIGARRSFFIEQKGGRVDIRSYNIHTEQLTTRKKRKVVREWVESHSDPRYTGMSETRQTSQQYTEQ